MSKAEPKNTSPGKSDDKAGDCRPAGDNTGGGSGSTRKDGHDSGRLCKTTAQRNNVFIGNLSIFTTNEKLQTFLEAKFGKGTVEDVRIMVHPETGRSRRFGFVTFNDPAVSASAMAEKIVLDDKNLDVKPAHNNPGNTSSRDGVGQSTGNKSSRVFVGGVSQDTSEEDFRAYFAQFGAMNEVNFLKDRDTGRNRGFGFINFEQESSVDLACSVQFHMLKGKKVEVKRANSSFGGGRNGVNSLALPLRGYDVRQGPTPKRGYTARFSPFGHHSPASAQPAAGMHLHAPYYRPVSATASTQDVSTVPAMVQAAAIQATLLNCYTTPPPTTGQQLYSTESVHNNWSYTAPAMYPQTYDPQTHHPYLYPHKTSYQQQQQHNPSAFK